MHDTVLRWMLKNGADYNEKGLFEMHHVNCIIATNANKTKYTFNGPLPNVTLRLDEERDRLLLIASNVQLGTDVFICTIKNKQLYVSGTDLRIMFECQ